MTLHKPIKTIIPVYKLSSYNPTKKYDNNTFFVLCKGLNSGRPSNTVNVNSFAITTQNQNDKKLIYWTCFGLHKGKIFYQSLCGSVIPFIRIGEFKKIVNENLQTVINKGDFNKRIKVLQKIEQLEINLAKQIKVNKELKIQFARSLFRKEEN